MPDPWEGVAADGTIVTGPAAAGCLRPSSRSWLTRPHLWAIAVHRCTSTVRSLSHCAAGSSDVDLLSIGLPDAAIVGRRLSGTIRRPVSGRRDRCCRDCRPRWRYGRCLWKPGIPSPLLRSPRAARTRRRCCPHSAADARAARGFNGDIAQHYRRWRQSLASRTEAPDLLGVRVARKTLLAVAGLVSVQDRTWTTDRSRAARRWSEIEPALTDSIIQLLSWVKTESADGGRSPARARQ